MVKDENIVVAYLEAAKRSWPRWRREHPDNPKLTAEIVESVTRQFAFAPGPVRVDLSSHSGGGSFLFGYINGQERIPDAIQRIVFLDSNYAFSDKDDHGKKLLQWLSDNPKQSAGGNCLR